jgi:hypothetical protein
MATLTVVDVVKAGVVPTFVAADVAGDEFVNDGQTMLVVKNDGSGSITVTIASQVQCNQGFTHNTTVTIAAGAEKWIGPLEVTRYNDENSKVQITYSGVTDVTVGAFQL